MDDTLKEILDNQIRLQSLNLLEEVKQMATEENMSIILREAWKLEESLKSSGFKVAFLGTKGVGKTSLINSLLEKDILPVGNLKGNTLFTEIKYSEDNLVIHSMPGKDDNVFSGLESEWEELYEKLPENQEQGTIQVGRNSSWLKEYELECLDTPAIESYEDKTLSEVETKILENMNDTLIKSDGVIFVINAHMILSETEIDFLDKHILTKKIPHMLIALKRMDQLSEEDRARVTQYVIDKLQYLGVNALVIDASTKKGVCEIRNKVENWVKDKNHYKLKAASICTQALLLIEKIKIHLNKEKNNLLKSESIKNEEIKLQKEAINYEGMKWEKYEIEMLKRCNGCYNSIESEIVRSQKTFVNELRGELFEVKNLSEWWNKEYPYSLKGHIASLSSELENILNERYTKDITWLSDTILEEFQVIMKSKSDKPYLSEEIELRRRFKPNFDDINKKKKLNKVGIGATTVLGFMVMGPFGTMLTVGGSLIAYEYFKRMNEDKQRQLITEAIEKDIVLVEEDLKMHGKEWIDKIYDSAIIEIKKQAENWIENQHTNLITLHIDQAQNINDMFNKKFNKITELKMKIKQWIIGDDMSVN